MRTLALFILALYLLGSSARAQNAAIELVQQAGLEYANGYTGPLGDMLSGVFNSGQYHTAKVRGLHVYVSLQSTAAIIPASAKTFSRTITLQTGNSSDLPVELRNQTIRRSFTNVPTILGDNASGIYLIDTVINGQLQQFGSVPGGIGTGVVPLLVPHVEIGSLLGTELILRGIPLLTTNSKIGTLSFYGVGLRHSLGSWIPLLPIDISVQAMYQHLGLGSFVTINAYNAAAVVSFDLPAWTLYGGVQIEGANANVHYSFGDTTLPMQAVDLNFLSPKNYRITAGMTMKLWLIHINAQATIAPMPTIGLGVGIEIPPTVN
jgi:hypothetical protein